jgi:hypothetical protein
MLYCLVVLITIPSLLVAQEPPRVKEAPKAPTPGRIRVGCAVQAAYLGPAPQWFNSVDSLSEEQIADLEKLLSTVPEDICARGYLIAHGKGRVSRRKEHVLWMIEHHPEWDGFLLGSILMWIIDGPAANDQIRAAWLQQTGPDQQSGTVLHHAAVFFEWREPDYAEALLKRAIDLEPNVAFHVERLGIMYGRSQFGSRNPSFAARAKSALLSSTDPLIVAGALNEMRPHNKGADGDLGKLLLARLGELAGDRSAIEVLKDLPSRSVRYRRYQCDPIPLLRRCVDP